MKRVLISLGGMTLGGHLVMSYQIAPGKFEHCVILLDGSTARVQSIAYV